MGVIDFFRIDFYVTERMLLIISIITLLELRNIKFIWNDISKSQKRKKFKKKSTRENNGHILVGTFLKLPIFCEYCSGKVSSLNHFVENYKSLLRIHVGNTSLQMQSLRRAPS